MKDVAYSSGYKDTIDGTYDENKVTKDMNDKVPEKYHQQLKNLGIDIKTEIFDKVIEQYRLGHEVAIGEKLIN